MDSRGLPKPMVCDYPPAEVIRSKSDHIEVGTHILLLFAVLLNCCFGRIYAGLEVTTHRDTGWMF
jgi:hypothetical protein